MVELLSTIQWLLPTTGRRTSLLTINLAKGGKEDPSNQSPNSGHPSVIFHRYFYSNRFFKPSDRSGCQRSDHILLFLPLAPNPCQTTVCDLICRAKDTFIGLSTAKVKGSRLLMDSRYWTTHMSNQLQGKERIRVSDIQKPFIPLVSLLLIRFNNRLWTLLGSTSFLREIGLSLS
ncbi:hypothetical protein O6H91_02G070500 [Diphasiastrum complanatum]|uniref:Uncharacterized protein n=1 Tax=Diphasiastrum complanatum TaxID=34168 RepID=A0ACC2EGR7_DIPCM|nr:hypothetical protein O6H91_02G070500 [Diphasiastrum complanatum]